MLEKAEGDIDFGRTFVCVLVGTAWRQDTGVWFGLTMPWVTA